MAALAKPSLGGCEDDVTCIAEKGGDLVPAPAAMPGAMDQNEGSRWCGIEGAGWLDAAGVAAHVSLRASLQRPGIETGERGARAHFGHFHKSQRGSFCGDERTGLIGLRSDQVDFRKGPVIYGIVCREDVDFSSWLWMLAEPNRNTGPGTAQESGHRLLKPGSAWMIGIASMFVAKCAR
jgi:hypothetical protein